MSDQQSSVLVTGVGSPTGRAIALELARAGYRPLLTSLTPDNLAATVKRLADDGFDDVPSHAADLGQRSETAALLEWARSVAPNLSSFVHCAFGHCGEGEGRGLADLEEQELDGFLRSSVGATWNLFAEVARGVGPQHVVAIVADWGLPQHNVLTSGSVDGEDIGSEPYVSAKYAVSGLLAATDRQSIIRTTGIYPGILATTDDGVQLDIDDDPGDREAAIPLCDVAAAVKYALSTSCTVRTVVLKPRSHRYDGIDA